MLLTACLPAITEWEYRPITGGNELPLETSIEMCTERAENAGNRASRDENKRSFHVYTYKKCMQDHGWIAVRDRS